VDWQNVLGVAATIFALASAAGLGLMRGTVANLRASNDDLRLRVGDLEKERSEDRASLAEVRGENALLRSMVTGKVEWVALTDQLEEHHRQALKHWSKIAAGIEAINRDLGGKR
jgi:hypothetical protein